MVEDRKKGRDDGRASMGDITEYCPNCGARGVWRKCKLICDNPKCGAYIVLACVD